MKIPYLDLSHQHRKIKQELVSSFESVLDSNRLVLSEEVAKFEKECSEFCHSEFSIGVASGLDAMIIALRCLEIGPGDEVIVPSNTYIATWLAVSRVGAKPIPVEADIRTYNIDPTLIEESITDKTKAIIPVHLYGQPAEMDTILEIAKHYTIKVIEDNAQSFAAKWQGNLTGGLGHINASSFYPGKNFGALGDAGMIHTNDPVLAEKARSLRNYGSSKKYYNDYLGYNSRLDEMQAAMLSVKLKYLENWNNERTRIAEIYLRELMNMDQIVLPFYHDDAKSVFHIFPIRATKRNALRTHLEKEGIQTLIHYPVPPHLQKAYEMLAYDFGDFPIAEEIANTELSLPIYPGLKEEQIQFICHAIKSFYQ